MRNPNGYGSVIKLSGKRRRPYAVRVTVGIARDDQSENLNYKQKYKYIGYYETRKEALGRLAEYNASKPETSEAITSLVESNRKNITIPTFKEVYEKWYERKQNSSRDYSERTYALYRTSFNKLKSLWDIPVNLLDYSTIQPVINSFSNQSKPVLTGIRTVLVGVIDQAILEKYAKENYAKLCDYNFTKTTEKLHMPYTDKEVGLLWKNKDNFFAKLALITIYTGMRPTELLLIENSKINFKENGMVGGIKTSSGKNRFIPIHKKIMPLIESLYNENNKYLVSIDGHSLPYSTFRKNYKKMCNSLKLQHTPHDGRHTCASALERAGIELLLRQRILGHASGNVTESVYTTVDKKRIVEAINKIVF